MRYRSWNDYPPFFFWKSKWHALVHGEVWWTHSGPTKQAKRTALGKDNADEGQIANTLRKEEPNDTFTQGGSTCGHGPSTSAKGEWGNVPTILRHGHCHSGGTSPLLEEPRRPPTSLFLACLRPCQTNIVAVLASYSSLFFWCHARTPRVLGHPSLHIDGGDRQLWQLPAPAAKESLCADGVR